MSGARVPDLAAATADATPAATFEPGTSSRDEARNFVPTPAAADGTIAPPATVSVAGVPASLVRPTGGTQSVALAAELFDLQNAARLHEGLPILRRSAELEQVALVRAENLVDNGYFDHYAPDGESAFSELAARGIHYRLAGENLARNNYPDSGTVQAAFDGLMASPGHRANILEGRFSQAGVAAVRSDKMWIYVTVFQD
jgi:uncharacterized protein YkwD